jgi:hypothetical protein
MPYESPHRNLIPDFTVLLGVTDLCEVNGCLGQGLWQEAVFYYDTMINTTLKHVISLTGVGPQYALRIF